MDPLKIYDTPPPPRDTTSEINTAAERCPPEGHSRHVVVLIYRPGQETHWWRWRSTSVYAHVFFRPTVLHSKKRPNNNNVQVYNVIAACRDAVHTRIYRARLMLRGEVLIARTHASHSVNWFLYVRMRIRPRRRSFSYTHIIILYKRNDYERNKIRATAWCDRGAESRDGLMILYTHLP